MEDLEQERERGDLEEVTVERMSIHKVTKVFGSTKSLIGEIDQELFCRSLFFSLVDGGGLSQSVVNGKTEIKVRDSHRERTVQEYVFWEGEPWVIDGLLSVHSLVWIVIEVLEKEVSTVLTEIRSASYQIDVGLILIVFSVDVPKQQVEQTGSNGIEFSFLAVLSLRQCDLWGLLDHNKE